MALQPYNTRYHYIVMRHGESTTNVSHLMITDSKVDGIEHGLTDNGKNQCKLSAKNIKTLIDKYGYSLDDVYIYYSDFQRAKESALIVFEHLFGVKNNDINYKKHFIPSKLLRARNYGDLNGKKG
eukprot:416376_1